MSDPIPDEPQSTGLTGQQIAQSAGVVMAGFILSRVLGLVRDIVIASVFGAGKQVDIFFAASRPPETLFFVVAGGALGSAFIPQFISLITANKRAEAWRMASVVTNLITLVLILLSVLGVVFALPLVQTVIAPEFDLEAAQRVAELMQIMLISPALFGISGLVMGMLNAHQRFALPALAPAMYNVGIIIGALVLSPFMGIDGLAWGTVLGAALHLLVQLPGLARLNPTFALSFDLKSPGVLDVARLMVPRVLGLAIVQINFWVELVLASGMVEGSIAALRRAFIIMLLPQGVIAQSVAIAVFPTFSAQVASGDTSSLRRTLNQVLRAVMFLSLPATVGLIILRLPIVRVMFERNQFLPKDSQAVAWALLFYALGLVAHCLLEVVTRAYYAMHDTRTPVIIGGGAMILNIVFSLILMNLIGQPGSLVMGPFGGLALANTLATTIEVGALLVMIGPRMGQTTEGGGSEARDTLISTLKMVIASAGMGLALWLFLPIIQGDGWTLIALTIGGIVLGGVVYGLLAFLLHSDEARQLTSILAARFRRSPN